MATAAQLAHYCADHFPQHKAGISMLTTVISSLVSAATAGGLAWYIRGRGITGVQTDISNIKNDIENLKAKLLPSVVATPVVVAPAVAS